MGKAACTCAKAMLNFDAARIALRTEALRVLDVILDDVGALVGEQPPVVETLPGVLKQAYEWAASEKQKHEAASAAAIKAAKEIEREVAQAAARAEAEAAKAAEEARKEIAKARKQQEAEAKRLKAETEAEAKRLKAEEEAEARAAAKAMDEEAKQQAKAQKAEQAAQRAEQAAEQAAQKEYERLARAEATAVEARERKAAAERAKAEAERAKSEAAEAKRLKAEEEAEAKAAAKAMNEEARQQAKAQKAAQKEAERLARAEAAIEEARERQAAAERAKAEAERAKSEAAERARREADMKEASPRGASAMAQQRLERAQSRISLGGLGLGPRAPEAANDGAKKNSITKTAASGKSRAGPAVERVQDEPKAPAQPEAPNRALEAEQAAVAAEWMQPWRGGAVRDAQIQAAADCIAVDGDEIACAGASSTEAKNELCICDVRTGAVLRVLRGGGGGLIPHTDRVCCVAFGSGASAHLIASGSRDQTVRVWDRDTGVCLRMLVPCDATPLTVAMRDKVLMSGEAGKAGRGAKARLWTVGGDPDEERAILPTVLAEHGGSIWSVAVGDRVAVSASDDSTARVWTLSGSARSIATLMHPAGVWVGSASVCGDLAATGCSDGKVRLWSLSAGFACLRTLEHSKQADRGAVNLLCARLMLGGGVLLSGGPDGIVKMWSLCEADEQEAACVASFAHGSSGVRSLATSGEVTSEAAVGAAAFVVSAGGAGTGPNIAIWRAAERERV